MTTLVLARMYTEDVSDAVANVVQIDDDGYYAIVVPVEDDALLVEAVAVPVQEDNNSSTSQSGEAYVNDTMRNVMLLDFFKII